jgi:HSP20 family molecular chaperone IbpA
VSGDEVRVVVDGEYVQVSGRRTLSRAGQNQRHLLIELPQGPFERVLRMRAPYDADGVTAKLENGILTVELPRTRAARAPSR